MWNKLQYLLIICLLVLIKQPVNSQEFNNRTASKEFRDSISLGKNLQVNITAKKGHIVITRWDKNMVWVWVRMTFTNPDVLVARKELEYSRYNFIKTSSGVNINNYFSIPQGEGNEKIKSLIRIDYHIKVPDGVILVIKNEYGSCTVTDINALALINNKYGEVFLKGLSGKTRIYANLCDIRAINISGSSEFYASNSTINLKNINGQITIQNKVGSLQIEPGLELQHLLVNCYYNDINLYVKEASNYSFNLQAKNGTIETGERFRNFPFTKKSKNLLEYYSDHTSGTIEIVAFYNSIKLN